MQKEILVPPMGESVTEATLGRWVVSEGSFVKVDQLLVELETDKVTLEIYAPASGILEKILVPQGETVAVGTLIGYLKEGSVSAQEGSSPPSTGPSQKEKPSTFEKGLPSVMPSAEKMMKEKNLSPNHIEGTGKGGRVLKEDVIGFLETSSQKECTSQKIRQEERVPMTRLRQRISERLKEAQNQSAILTTFNEVDMTHVMALRERLKDPFEKKHGVRLGFMSFFVRASVIALREIPGINAEIQGQTIVYKNYYDIGVAVGTPQGLVVPVVRDAQTMSFAAIEKEISRLGIKARDGKLTLDDLSGGTFTISNGGVYGSLLSTPILNPPQSGILGMHKIQKRPVVIGDEIKIRSMMYVALSYDHRLVDGREAVTFLVRVKENLEDPERMLLDL
ncbi:MAG: 2-oxoglutarate dehydrogenase complex dihydrolipoyllysine-residue succinyltransferase [Holosporales bacterium]